MTSRLAALAFAALAFPACAACDLLGHQRVQASPHVILFQAPEGTPGVVNGNTVAIIGRQAVLVVDPGQFPAAAQRVLAEIRKATKAPVTHVVNTHWHGDHLLANSVYKDAFPAAKIVAHSHTIAEAAKRYGADYAEKTRKSVAGVADFYRRKRETTSDDEREWIDRTFECVAQLETQLDHTRPVTPDTPMDGTLEVDLGGVTASIRHFGTGNTPGDLVVWVPQDRLIATGDIVVHPAPYAIGSELGPWPATLDRVLALSPAVIVPGHGPAMRDDRYLRDLRALLVSTQSQVDALLAQGVAKADAPARLDTAAFRERYIATPMQRQAFDKFFVRSVVEAAWPKAKPPS